MMDDYIYCGECGEDLSEETYLIKYNGPLREEYEDESRYFCSTDCAMESLHKAYNPYGLEEFKKYVSDLEEIKREVEE